MKIRCLGVAVALLSCAAVSAASAVKPPGNRPTIAIANAQVAFAFDRQTGALISLKNLATGDEYLKDPGGDGNPFRAYVDTTELPAVLKSAKIQPVEDAMGGKLVDACRCRLVESSLGRDGTAAVLRLVMQYADPALTFALEVRLPDNDVAAELRLTVRNHGSTARRVMTAFPYLTGLALGPDRGTNLGVRVIEFGQSRAPAWDNSGDIYGRAWGGQWNAVYEASKCEGLGLVVKDAELRNKVLRRFPGGGMSVFYFDDRTLKPGEAVRFPATELVVNRGDWKLTARRYGQWFASAFPLRKPPAWLDDVDWCTGAWFPAPDVVAKDKGLPGKARSFRSFAELPRLYVQRPVDLLQWGQYWQGVVRMGKVAAYHHTDGIYDFRQDLGGAEAMREGVSRAEKLGRYAGLYVAAHTVRLDSPFFSQLHADTKPQDWLWMETPDKKVPDDAQSIPMCLRYAPWQDHLAAVCKRLLRETHARYIRLDESIITFTPCHNPAHHHASPWQSTREVLSFLRKVREAMDEVDPQSLLCTEQAVDLANLYTNGVLCIWSGGPDIPPARLATPDFIGFSYNLGEVECALDGYVPSFNGACNRAGWWSAYHGGRLSPGLERPPKSYPKEGSGAALRWHELRHTFCDAAFHGDPTDVNPVAPGEDPNEWAGRLWRSPKYWLLVCGNRAAVRPSKPVRVKLPELPSSVRHAFEFDTETLAMREAPLARGSDGVYVTLTAGFSAVLLPMPDCPPLVKMADPPPVRVDRPIELELTAFAPWRATAAPVQVELSAPGLAVAPQRLSLPGRVKISMPPQTEPGRYAIRVSGDCLALKRWTQVR